MPISVPSGSILVKKMNGVGNFIEDTLQANDIPIETIGTAFTDFNVSGTNIQTAFNDLVNNLRSNIEESVGGLDNITLVSGNTTLDSNYDTVLTFGSITISLPTSSSVIGKTYKLKKTDSNSTTLTIDPYGSETIDGFSTIELYESNSVVVIQADGSNWRILYQCGMTIPNYTISNYSADRSIDVSNTTINELANMVCTLIGDLSVTYLGGIINQYITNNGGAITIGESSSTKMHTFRGYTREYSPTISLSTSGSENLDCSLRSAFRKTGGTATITLSGLVENQTVTVIMESIGSAYTITWSGASSESFRWAWGSLPTPTATASGYDLYSFLKLGDSIYGSSIMDMR